MKQGCVLAPTLFGAVFAEAFEDTAEGNYLRTKPDGMLFNISTLKQIPNEISAWSPLCQLTMQPSPPTHQRPSAAHEPFQQGVPLTTSLKNKNTGHGAERVNLSPSITILEFELEVVHDCIYLGSTISDILSLKSEENSSYHPKPDQDSMVQQEVNGKYQNPGLQSQQFEHTAVKQRVLESSRTTGEEA